MCAEGDPGSWRDIQTSTSHLMKLSCILNGIFFRKSGEFYLTWGFTAIAMHRCNYDYGFFKGMCLLFTNFDHIHLRIELKGIKSHHVKNLGRKISVCVKKKKQSCGLCSKYTLGRSCSKTESTSCSLSLYFCTWNIRNHKQELSPKFPHNLSSYLFRLIKKQEDERSNYECITRNLLIAL